MTKFTTNFKEAFYAHIKSTFGKTYDEATDRERYAALSQVVMLHIADDWIATSEKNKKGRNAYYLSAEFLVGRSLGNNLLNLGLLDEVSDLLEDMGVELNALEEMEEDAALGNGGLGRLAACFVESAATCGLPVQGYGVRYSEGLFKQYFENGFQREKGDNWTKYGDPWSIRKESEAKIVTFRDQQVRAIPYDMPIIGYENNEINTLRLWQAEALHTGGFDFNKFNNFQYDASVSEKNRAEDITRVLYPNDIQRAGKVLRLKQQYFFVSASIQDLLDRYKTNFPEDVTFKNFPDYHIMQLNDTHPVIAIPELMRLLMDDEGLSWNDATDICNKVFAFTNHTILQEAMEKWSIDIMQEVSPRCYELITEIDRRLVATLKDEGYDDHHVNRMRIIHDGVVEMAFLAIHTAVSVNGVAWLHTEILKDDTLKDWYALYPEKFNNKTNGITPRRWLMYSNPELAAFITKHLGSDDWKSDLMLLKDLEKFVDDKDVLKELQAIKHTKKEQLAAYILAEEGIEIDPNAIFDVQVKRLHEYKRQLLNALHIVDLYNRLKENPDLDIVPRTFIFGAKAAPGYFRARAIIKFINEIAKLINNDPDVNQKIKVVFVHNYRVSYGEKIFPAADVSEQISTAGKEASGTGNMKFMMNAANTIGSYDGANVEIVKYAGMENNFIFGARVEELNEIGHSYNPKEYYHTNFAIQKAVDMLLSDKITDNGTYMFLDIYNELVNPQNGGRGDVYYILKDFESYKEAQEQVDRTYRDSEKWAKMCLMNLANSGYFSSDRTIQQYASEIWKIS